MLNKTADTIAYTYPFPAKYWLKNSTFTLSELGRYFLFFIFSIFIISRLVVRKNGVYGIRTRGLNNANVARSQLR